MKKKKGFTLIELLAVIIILAIIALIATPIIMRVIERSKKGAAERSAENYVSAVETEAMTLRTEGTILDGTYGIKSNGNLCLDKSTTCNESGEIKIDMSGKKPSSGSVVISNGKVTSTGTSLTIEDYTVTINESGSATATKNGSQSNTQLASGLYKDGVIYKTWAELKEEHPNSITDDGQLKTLYVDDDEMDMHMYVGVSIFSEYSGECDLVIDDSINTLNGGSFSFPTNLTWKSITIPTSVTTISAGAFGDSGIDYIEYLGTKAEWNTLVPSIKDVYCPGEIYDEAYAKSETLLGKTALVVSCTDGDLNYNLIDEIFGN